jgi:hypothetical protein
MIWYGFEPGQPRWEVGHQLPQLRPCRSSSWLPTVAARVSVRAARGVCGGQSSTEAGFLRVLRCPLPIITPISLTSYSPGAGTIGLLVAAVPSGPNWTQPTNIPIKKLSQLWQASPTFLKHIYTFCVSLSASRGISSRSGATVQAVQADTVASWGVKSFRGCTCYRNFLLICVEWKLIFADFLSFLAWPLIVSNLKIFYITVN